MLEPEMCTIDYCGYSKPHTPEELEFEILGLQVAICQANSRISRLKQSKLLISAAVLAKSGGDNDKNNIEKAE